MTIPAKTSTTSRIFSEYNFNLLAYFFRLVMSLRIGKRGRESLIKLCYNIYDKYVFWKLELSAEYLLKNR